MYTENEVPMKMLIKTKGMLAYIGYAYNPESKIGKRRMLKFMIENNDELERIM